MGSKPRKGKHDDKVSAFVDEFWKREFRAPTIREVMAACGITSSGAATNVIHRIAQSSNYILAGGVHITPTWVISAIENAGAT